MSAGSKLSLAVIVLFAALLGVYYGFGGPGLGTGAQDASLENASPPVVGKPRQVVTSEWPSRPATKTPPPAVNPVIPTSTPTSSPWSTPNAATASNEAQGIRLLSLQESRRRGDAAKGDAGHSFYTVQSDDSMWTIAHKWLGNGARWQEIAKLNPGLDADRLDVGMKLRMPPKSEPKSAKAKSEPVKTAGSTIHTVGAGDSLATIASRYLQAAHRWEIIYDANRHVIGNDPHALKIGMKLQIPKQ